MQSMLSVRSMLEMQETLGSYQQVGDTTNPDNQTPKQPPKWLCYLNFCGAIFSFNGQFSVSRPHATFFPLIFLQLQRICFQTNLGVRWGGKGWLLRKLPQHGSTREQTQLLHTGRSSDSSRFGASPRQCVCVDSLAIPAQSSFCYLQCGCVFGLYRGREPGSFGTDEIVKSRNDDVGQQIVVA